jgi:hypothetical protein
MPRVLEQALGVALMLVILLDVFLTVLYARMGAGILSPHLARTTWRVFREASKPFGRYRPTVLSLCGPSILVSLVLVWAFALTLGAALIIHQRLGTSVRAVTGETPRDFVTALYAGGSSLSIVGPSSFSPQTGVFRLVFLFNSLVGMSVVSLTLTYVMQVYSALQRRNTLGLKIHLQAGATADSAELVAGLGPEGRFDGGYTNLAEMAAEMANAKESHHLYPVLFYYRFREPYYSVSRFTLMTLDAVTLIKSALDDKQHGWLKESASVTQLWLAALRLVITLEETFLGGRAENRTNEPDAPTVDRWRRRYSAAVRRLRQAGVKIIADERAGAETYVGLRAQWDRDITNLAPAMAYTMEEIDPVGTNPEISDQRPEFRARLRSIG